MIYSFYYVIIELRELPIDICKSFVRYIVINVEERYIGLVRLIE